MGEFRLILQQLVEDWQSKDYDILRHNCCDFSDDMCVRLGVGHVPSWVTNLADAGAKIANTKHAAGQKLANIHIIDHAKQLGRYEVKACRDCASNAGFKVG